MLRALFEFFAQLFYILDLEYQLDILEFVVIHNSTNNTDLSMSVNTYLAWLCSVISLIFIVVLCCLFVYKIIKLVGNLIR